jgi:hypothetical protein
MAWSIFEVGKRQGQIGVADRFCPPVLATRLDHRNETEALSKHPGNRCLRGDGRCSQAAADCMERFSFSQPASSLGCLV